MTKSALTLKTLTNYFTGKPFFELGYYREAELTRLLNLFAHVDLERWKGLKILEVGAGTGNIGVVFAQLGFDVTSTDGRPEHVEYMQGQGRKAFVLDLDNTGVDEAGDFDVILAFGVLYHLTEPEKFLKSCGKKAKVLLLETIVSDSAESTIHPVAEAKGWRGKDQALNELGCRPSPIWIEQTARSAGFNSVRDISSPVANWAKSRFDWLPRNSGEYKRDGFSLRKMWIFEKI